MLLHANELVPFNDFESASRAALALCHERLGFDLWMMTRTDGINWIVLQADDRGYNVKEGDVFQWADSFCTRMVQGRGPRIAPCAQEVPSYAEAPIGRQVAIGAYIGVPIHNANGSLFGTLCAIDPTPKAESIQHNLPWIEMIARMLSTILANERKVTELSRLVENSEHASRLDLLTGFLNRDGWEEKLRTEEARSRRYGSPACIWFVVLTGEKDDIRIRNVSQILLATIKNGDCIAHFGGGEFALLGVECDSAQAAAMSITMRGALDEKRIKASLGSALRDPSKGLSAAMEQARQ